MVARTGFFVVLSALALGGCEGARESVHLVAVGARDVVPLAFGVCRIAEARPSAPVHFGPTGETYEAVDPGRVRIPCERGVVVLDVRRASRISVDTSRVAKRGDFLVMQAQAFDESGARLSIGEAPVLWSFTGALASRTLPECSDGETPCPPRNAGYAGAYDEGEGQVLARFGGLSSRIVVTVTP